MATQLTGDRAAPSTYAFKVGLLIRHPIRDLTSLSAVLKVEPDFVRVAGHPRLTPRGRPIEGFYSDSLWSKYELVKNDKDFTKSVDVLLDMLLPFQSVFEDIASSGGCTKIVVQLPGEQNHGLQLKAASARKLATLNIDVGLEVFPSFTQMRASE